MVMEIMLKPKGRKKKKPLAVIVCQSSRKTKKKKRNRRNTNGLFKTVRSMRKSQKQSRIAELMIVVVLAKIVGDCSRRR